MLINYTLGSNKKKNLIEIRENFIEKEREDVEAEKREVAVSLS